MLITFNHLGHPSILRSDNGTEFVNRVMDGLVLLFPGMQFICGRPRHSQSQGSVESANKSVQWKLAAMMKDANTRNWPSLVPAAQNAMNNQQHSATKQVPYALVFGHQPRPRVFPELPQHSMILDEEDVQEYIAVEQLRPIMYEQTGMRALRKRLAQQLQDLGECSITCYCTR